MYAHRHSWDGPRLLISPLPTDQHTISSAHARIYSLALATLRNHCSNLDLSSSTRMTIPVAITSTALIPISSLQVYNYFRPYCPIIVYRFSLPINDHHFLLAVLCSTPPKFRFGCFRSFVVFNSPHADRFIVLWMHCFLAHSVSLSLFFDARFWHGRV